MRRAWTRSLGAKLFAAFALVATLGVGTVALVAYQATTRQFTLYVSSGRQVRAERWAALISEAVGQLPAAERAEPWVAIAGLLQDTVLTQSPEQGRGLGRGLGRGGQSASGDRLLIISPQGQVMYDTGNELLGQSVEGDVQESGASLVLEGETIGTLIIAGPESSGYSTLESQFLDAITRAVLWAALAAVAASTIAVAVLSRGLVAPLRRLTSAADAMADGDLSQRVAVRSRDEVGELGEAFNAMASDLETSDLQRRQMTADIAHELRNPLSVIRGNLEAMLDGVYPTDAEHLVPVHEETLLLQHLVEDLRLLSLAEDGQLGLTRTDVDLALLLRGVAQGAQAAAGDKGISLRVDIPGQPPVADGDATRLRQVVGNLVGNALCYTPNGGAITLRAHQDAGRVWISVSDTGQGIPAQDLPRIFDRFYRGDAARDRATGGSGLGLAIAKALVEAHHGTIEAESEPGVGTTVTIGLPRAHPS